MSGETVADRRLHPATILLRVVKNAPSTVLALPAAIAFLSDRGLGWALLAAGLAATVIGGINALGWYRFRYGVGEADIVIESGILSRNRRNIPFARIQDIDIERALLARIFGLSKIRIETGAGGKDEGVLDSVTVAEAARLRETVRAWREGEAPAPEPVSEAVPRPAAAQTLYALDLPRLLLFGLFNFSLVYIAGLFALLQSVDQWLPFDIYDPARWIGLVGDLPSRFTPAALAVVLFLAILLGVLAGIVRTVARDYGFQLSIEGRRFRREHGLFTRKEAVIARRRVQLGLVQTGPLRRLLGWFSLSFQTLGAGAGASGHQSAAPFARKAELEPILVETQSHRLPPVELEMVSRRHILRVLATSLVPAAVVIAALALKWPQALLLAALLPLIGLRAAAERRFHRYAIKGELLFVARGLWRQRLWLVPLRNVRALSLSRSWLQRRLGLATLSVDTAGASMLSFPRILDLRSDIAERLAAEIADYSSGRKSGTER
jgi:putative membrane protein